MFNSKFKQIILNSLNVDKLLSSFTLLCSLILMVVYSANAQNASVSLTSNSIPLNDFLELSVTLSDETIKNIGNFPDIPGFIKRGKTNSTESYSNGTSMQMKHIIKQSYQPTKEGAFSIKPFSIAVNGKTVNFKGGLVRVTAPEQRKSNDPFAAFFELFDARNTREMANVKADAFFAVTSDRSEVYVGEGFTLTVALYVAKTNQAEMSFYKPGEQITDILQQVRPKNVWEENFGISEIIPEEVTVNGRAYTQYKLYQGTFFSYSTELIKIPASSLKMVSYKRSFAGISGGETLITLPSMPKQIKVKPLPPHPLSDKVAVGVFRLREKINKTSLKTGESIPYTFQIEGQGNISALAAPTLKSHPKLELFPPTTRQQINRSSNTVYGMKAFSYQIIPSEAGNYPLDEQIEWVFFNTLENRYDTLRPDVRLNVSGESTRNKNVNSNDFGELTTLMQNESNDLRSGSSDFLARVAINFLVLLLLCVGVWVYWARSRRES